MQVLVLIPSPYQLIQVYRYMQGKKWGEWESFYLWLEDTYSDTLGPKLSRNFHAILVVIHERYSANW